MRLKQTWKFNPFISSQTPESITSKLNSPLHIQEASRCVRSRWNRVSDLIYQAGCASQSLLLSKSDKCCVNVSRPSVNERISTKRLDIRQRRGLKLWDEKYASSTNYWLTKNYLAGRWQWINISLSKSERKGLWRLRKIGFWVLSISVRSKMKKERNELTLCPWVLLCGRRDFTPSLVKPKLAQLLITLCPGLLIGLFQKVISRQSFCHANQLTSYIYAN